MVMILPDIFQTRSRCMVKDYLVRKDDWKRAILVVVPTEPGDTFDHTTEFEKMSIIVAASRYAQKRRWKFVIVKFSMGQVFCHNAANCYRESLGTFAKVSNEDHFLNDSYYNRHEGFWIKRTNTSTQ